METPITNKVQEILTDGANYEQQRSTGIIIRSKINWFDAVEDDGRGTNEGNGEESKGVVTYKERTFTPNTDLKISDIP